jgi:hypothetical protein
MLFEGWVPNATGNLSFSAIGNSLVRGVRLRQNFWCEDNRWAICAQERHNRDRQIPSLARTDHPQRLIYILTGRSMQAGSDVEGAISGEIAILSLRSNEGVTALEVARVTQNFLTVARDAYRLGLHYDKPTDESWTHTQRQIHENALFFCSFTLLRNGKCFLRANPTAIIDATTLQWLVSQCYFFLKDSIHKHYHHQSSTDAIIEVTETQSIPDWRLRTLRNLYRKVLQMRRYFNGGGLSDALGVLAYAKTFREIFGTADFLETGDRIEDDIKILPEYSSEVGESIEIRRDAARRAYDQRKTDAQFLVASAVAIVAVFISLFDHFDKPSRAYKFGEFVAKVLGAHPIFLLVPFIIFGTLYREYIGQDDPAGRPTVRWAYRLFAWLKKETLVAALLGVATALAGAAIYLFGQAVIR